MTPAQRRVLERLATGNLISFGGMHSRTARILVHRGWIKRDKERLAYGITEAGRSALRSERT